MCELLTNGGFTWKWRSTTAFNRTRSHLKKYQAKVIEDRGLIFMPFFPYCNVLNRQNKQKLENYHKHDFLQGLSEPLGFSVTTIPLGLRGLTIFFVGLKKVY